MTDSSFSSPPPGRTKSPSLGTFLPLIVVLVLLLAFAVMFLVTTQRGEGTLLDNANAFLRAEAVQLAQEAEGHRDGNLDDVRRQVQHLLGDPRVQALAVMDVDDRVLAAHRAEWVGQLARDVLPAADADAARWATAKASRVPLLRQADDGLVQTAIVSYARPSDPDRVRSDQRGVVYLALDLHSERARLLERVWRNRGVDIVLAVALSVVLAWGLRRWVVRPLRAVERATRRLARGETDVQLPETGPAEVASLAQGFNQMARALSTAQAELRASEERLSTILYSTGDAMMALDVHLGITLLNPVAEALTGWTEADALGRPVREVFRIENAQTGEPAVFPLERVVTEGVVLGLANHTRLIARDGRRTHIADSAAPIRLSDHSLGGVVIVFRDVTQQYELEEALARSEWHFRTLANSGRAMVWTTDERGRNDWNNQQWADFVGAAASSESGDNAWMACIHPDDHRPVIEIWREARSRLEPMRTLARYRRHDGQYRWILHEGAPRFDPDGRFKGYIGHGLDITDQHDATERLQAQVAELRRWHEAMLGREARVSELKAEVNELLARQGQPARYASVDEGPRA